jgi:hypothetical protein
MIFDDDQERRSGGPPPARGRAARAPFVGNRGERFGARRNGLSGTRGETATIETRTATAAGAVQAQLHRAAPVAGGCVVGDRNDNAAAGRQ